MSRARVAVLQFPGVNCEAETRARARARRARGRGVPLDAARARTGALSTPSSCPAASRTRTACAPARSRPRIRWSTRSPSRRSAASRCSGICNGAQVLVEAGLVPGRRRRGARAGAQSHAAIAPATTRAGLYCRVEESPCVFTRRLPPGTVLPLPVAHGEGRFTAARDPAVMRRSLASGQVPLRYVDADGELARSFPDNPNGSRASAAAVVQRARQRAGDDAAPRARARTWARSRARSAASGARAATRRSSRARRAPFGAVAGHEHLRGPARPPGGRMTRREASRAQAFVELRAEDPEATSALAVARAHLEAGRDAGGAAPHARLRAGGCAAGRATRSRSGCTARRSSTTRPRSAACVRADRRRSAPFAPEEAAGAGARARGRAPPGGRALVAARDGRRASRCARAWCGRFASRRAAGCAQRGSRNSRCARPRARTARQSPLPGAPRSASSGSPAAGLALAQDRPRHSKRPRRSA